MWSCQVWSSIPMATKSSSFCSCTSNRGLGAYHCQPCPHFTEAQVRSNVHQLNPIPASIIQLGLLVSQDPLRYMGLAGHILRPYPCTRGHLPYIQRVPVPMLPLDLLIISRLALAFLSRSLQPQWLILYDKTESIWNIKISKYSYSSYVPYLMPSVGSLSFQLPDY